MNELIIRPNCNLEIVQLNLSQEFEKEIMSLYFSMADYYPRLMVSAEDTMCNIENDYIFRIASFHESFDTDEEFLYKEMDRFIKEYGYREDEAYSEIFSHVCDVYCNDIMADAYRVLKHNRICTWLHDDCKKEHTNHYNKEVW